jgi:hypothetical protein
MSEWQPIETAPRDGRTFQIRERDLAPSIAYYKDGELRHVSFEHTNRPTHWRPYPPKEER